MEVEDSTHTLKETNENIIINSSSNVLTCTYVTDVTRKWHSCRIVLPACLCFIRINISIVLITTINLICCFNYYCLNTIIMFCSMII